MKKFLIVCLTCVCTVLLVLSLAACSDNPETIEDEQPPMAETPQPPPTATTPESALTQNSDTESEYEPLSEQPPEYEPESYHITPSAVLEEDVYSFKFSLNGEVFTVPFPFSQLEAAGWEAIDQDFASGRLDPNRVTLSSFPMASGDQRIRISLVNTTENVVYFSDAHVGSISFNEWDAQRGAELILPGDIAIGSTYEQVIATWGEPTERRGTDHVAELIYSLGRASQSAVHVHVNRESNLVREIRMQHLEERQLSEAPEIDMPAVVLAYEAPTTLGDNWSTFNINFADHLYTLPAPVAAFVANGWVIETDPNQMIAAQSGRVGVSMRLGNQTMRATIYNYDDSEQPISNTHITRIESSHHGATLPLELPGGISMESTLDEVIAIFGEPDRTQEGNEWITHWWGRSFEEITIVFIIETGEIRSIDVHNSPRRLG